MDTNKSVFIESIIFCCYGKATDKNVEDKLKSFSISKLREIIKKLYAVSEPLRASLLYRIVSISLRKSNIQPVPLVILSPNELLRNKSICLMKQACDIIGCWKSLKKVFMREIIDKCELDVYSIKRLSFFIRVLENKVNNVVVNAVNFNLELLDINDNRSIINNRIILHKKHLNNLIDFNK